MRVRSGSHALGHETLVLLHDHAVLLGHEKPGRPVLPQRPPHRDGDAGRRDRPLHRRQHGQFLRGGMLREGSREGRLRQPDQPVAVWCELGRLWMRLGPVEDIGDRLAFVRSERGDVDERLHLFAARRRDHRTRISVADENDRLSRAIKGSIKCRHIIEERGQRQRRRHHLDAVGHQWPDDLCPTGPVGPGAMDQHNSQIIGGHRFPTRKRNVGNPFVSPRTVTSMV
jgi:hypothetical protein